MPPAQDENPTLRFGAFELDVTAYELRKSGRPVRLERRPMDLLVLLVRRRGQLVLRSAIVEHLWGKDVFIEVEPGINTAIRKIRRALGDSPDSAAFIETVPGKGYRFIASVDQAAPSREPVPHVAPTDLAAGNGGPHNSTPVLLGPGEAQRPRERLRPLPIAAAVLLAATLIGITAWTLRSSTRSESAPGAEVIQLTTLAGAERAATFSPDSRQVAFAWSGEDGENWDIYVKHVASSDVHRLTMNPARDIGPRWSHGGGLIAYVRVEPSGQIEHLHVMSSLGGSDRKVSDRTVLPVISWSPDDRFVAAGVATTGPPRESNGIYLFPIDGGEPRQLTRAPASGTDWSPAFSPDGRHLAYVSCQLPMADCTLWVIDLNAAWASVGPPRRLAADIYGTVRGLIWSRDGESVIYAAPQGSTFYLWRLAVDGQRPPVRIELAGPGAFFPAVAPSMDRLAFSRVVSDEDVYRVDGSRSAQPVARSSVFDGNPQYSPDGRRIAFCSNRSGTATDVWLAAADGSGSEQLTRGPGQWQCAPGWSPDGRSVAFESRDETGASHVWTIGVDDHHPQQLTIGSADDRMPSWSKDGRWVYFSSGLAAARDIWRVSADGRSKERITAEGSGLAAVESAAGGTIFYLGRSESRLHEPNDGPLLSRPLAGGEPRTLIPCVRGTAFSVGAREIHYVRCRHDSPDGGGAPVRAFDLVTGREREAGMLERFPNGVPSGFAVSPDARAFLQGRLVSDGEDLMLIEHYR